MFNTPSIAQRAFAKGAVGAAVAAMTLAGAAVMPTVASAQDCSGASTVGGLVGAGAGAAAGSNLARGGGRTGGAIIGGVLGALVGTNAGRSLSGCERQGTYYAPRTQYAPAPQAYYSSPPQTYYEQPQYAPPPAYAYAPTYYAPTYYEPAPTVVVEPGYYYGYGRPYAYGRHHRW